MRISDWSSDVCSSDLLLIMIINIIGGLIIGVGQHDLAFSEAGRVYTLLTIGDGLVAQIPALVISTAAGVVVSRVATDQDVGQQMVSQLFANPNEIGRASCRERVGQNV